MRARCAVSAVVVCLGLAPHASGFGSVIPIADRMDHVYDPSRRVLFISTSAGAIERYDLATQSFLEPLNIGGDLRGIDITPNRSSLVVADYSVEGGAWIKVDIDTGATTTYNGGNANWRAWDVGVASNGKAVVTVDLPLVTSTATARTIDLATGAVGSIQDPLFVASKRMHVNRGVRHDRLIVTEQNLSTEDFGVYDAAGDAYIRSSGPTSAFQLVSFTDVSKDGAISAAAFKRVLNGPDIVRIFETAGPAVVAEIERDGVGGGMRFDPVRDRFYLVDPDADEIVIYDRTTWQEIDLIEIAEAITVNSGFSDGFGDGNLTITNDGQWLFVSVPSGIEQIRIPAPGAWVALAAPVIGLGRRRMRG